MKNIIIYNDKNLRVVHCKSSIEEEVIQEADRVAPLAVPYKIIDSSGIPADRTFRNAWEVDDSEITDGVGGELKARADLSQAESNLIEENKYLPEKQAAVVAFSDALANTEADFKAKEAAALKAEAEENAEESKKKRDEANLAKLDYDKASKRLERANHELRALKSSISIIEENKVATEKIVKQCLDALPLDKRSA